MLVVIFVDKIIVVVISIEQTSRVVGETVQALRYFCFTLPVRSVASPGRTPGPWSMGPDPSTTTRLICKIFTNRLRKF